jgi:predicted nucleic acid-binding Zn ribbon protein
MRNSNEQSLKEVIQDLLNAYRLRGKLKEVKLVNSWEKVMGKTIANRTSEVFIRDRILYVRVLSSPLKQELHYNRAKVIKMMNDEVGEEVVTSLVIL